MYCTLDDIRATLPEVRLVELTDDLSPNPSGSVNLGIVDQAIQGAGILIDAYIGRRYALPLSVIPPLLGKLAVDLAVYDLYRRRNELSVSDGMQLAYRNAIAMLKGVADGSVSIGLDPADAGKDSGLDAVFEVQEPVFTSELLSQW